MMQKHEEKRLDSSGHPLSRAEALRGDLGVVESRLETCEDEDQALELIGQREHLRHVVEAERRARNARLERQRAAAHAAALREQRIASLRERLTAAEAALERARSADGRAELERDIAFLRAKLVEAEAAATA